MPDRRAPARADARPPGRRRAVRAPAADPVARDDRRGLHERHLGPPRPARVARGLSAGQAPARRAGRPGRRARAQRRGPDRRVVRGRSAGRARSRTAAMAAARRARRRRRLDRGRRGRAPGAGGRRCRHGDVRRRADHADRRDLAIPGAHNVSNALAAVAVGARLRARTRRDPGGGCRLHRRRAPARAGRRQSTASASSTIRRGRSRTRWSPRCAPSSRRSSSSPAAATRASTCPAWPRSWPNAPSPPSSSARAGRRSRRAFRAAGLATTERAADLDDAVRRADATRPRRARRRPAAGTGPATVLLSPAAASFDMFVDYAARGRAFKASVAALAATRGAGGDR